MKADVSISLKGPLGSNSFRILVQEVYPGATRPSLPVLPPDAFHISTNRTRKTIYLDTSTVIRIEIESLEVMTIPVIARECDNAIDAFLRRSDVKDITIVFENNGHLGVVGKLSTYWSRLRGRAVEKIAFDVTAGALFLLYRCVASDTLSEAAIRGAAVSVIVLLLTGVWTLLSKKPNIRYELDRS